MRKTLATSDTSSSGGGYDYVQRTTQQHSGGAMGLLKRSSSGGSSTVPNLSSTLLGSPMAMSPKNAYQRVGGGGVVSPSMMASSPKYGVIAPAALNTSTTSGGPLMTYEDMARSLHPIKQSPSVLPMVEQLLESGASLASVVKTIEDHYIERIQVLEKAMTERSRTSLETQALQAMYAEEKNRADSLQEEVDQLTMRYKQVRPENHFHTGAGASPQGAATLTPRHQPPGSATSMMGTPQRRGLASPVSPGAQRGKPAINFQFSGMGELENGDEEDTHKQQQPTSPTKRLTTAEQRHLPLFQVMPTSSSGGRRGGHHHLGDSVNSFGNASAIDSIANGSSHGSPLTHVRSRHRSKGAAAEADVVTSNVAGDHLSMWELRMFNETLQKKMDIQRKELDRMTSFLDQGRAQRAEIMDQNRSLNRTLMSTEDELSKLRVALEKANVKRAELEAEAVRERKFCENRIDEFRGKIRHHILEGENNVRVAKQNLSAAHETFGKERKAWKEKEAALTLVVNAARRKAKDATDGKLTQEMMVVQEQLEPLRAALSEAVTRAEVAEAALDPLKQQLHGLLNEASTQSSVSPSKKKGKHTSSNNHARGQDHHSTRRKPPPPPASSNVHERGVSPVNADPNTLSIGQVCNSSNAAAALEAKKAINRQLSAAKALADVKEVDVSGAAASSVTPRGFLPPIMSASPVTGHVTTKKTAQVFSQTPPGEMHNTDEPLVSLSPSPLNDLNNSNNYTTGTSPPPRATPTSFEDTLDEETKRAIEEKLSQLEQNVMSGSSGAAEQPSRRTSLQAGGGGNRRRSSLIPGGSHSKQHSSPPLVDMRSNALLKLEHEMKREKKKNNTTSGSAVHNRIEANAAKEHYLSKLERRGGDGSNDSHNNLVVHRNDNNNGDGSNDSGLSSALVRRLAATKTAKRKGGGKLYR